MKIMAFHGTTGRDQTLPYLKETLHMPTTLELRRTPWIFLLALTFLVGGWPPVAAQTNAEAAPRLAGLWRAHRSFGPRIAGKLTITQERDAWSARIGPFSVPAVVKDGTISFDLPSGQGQFEGWFSSASNRIEGHWTQAATNHSGLPYASPVALDGVGKGRWSGEVMPFEDGFTFFLDLRLREDGSLGGWLSNPERNLGRFLNIDRLEIDGDRLRLVGAARDSSARRVFAEGTHHVDEDRLSIYMGSRGGTYDFERVDPSEAKASSFFPRGPRPAAYHYRPPSAERDGWKVGSLREVAISPGLIADMIETEILPPSASVGDLRIHGLLVARHGKLVLEEYFHGFHRDVPHDTRSASKSVTAILAGVVAHGDPSFGISSKVYDFLPATDPGPRLDPRKRRMRVGDLLTMSSGLDCDDGDSSSVGNEERMQEQREEPDWYRYTSRLPMVREPGEEARYCSATTNLLGSVLAAASGQSLPRLLHERLASPLQIERYHLFLTPSGDAYMGGGIHWLPRDFLKFGQLMLNGGTWNGRQIVSEEWATESVTRQIEIDDRGYGYLWWLHELPYRGHTVSAFFAGGNGGQLVLVVPELDLVIGFWAGNYSDQVALRIVRELVPEYILQAVDPLPK